LRKKSRSLVSENVHQLSTILCNMYSFCEVFSLCKLQQVNLVPETISAVVTRWRSPPLTPRMVVLPMGVSITPRRPSKCNVISKGRFSFFSHDAALACYYPTHVLRPFFDPKNIPKDNKQRIWSSGSSNCAMEHAKYKPLCLVRCPSENPCTPKICPPSCVPCKGTENR